MTQDFRLNASFFTISIYNKHFALLFIHYSVANSTFTLKHLSSPTTCKLENTRMENINEVHDIHHIETFYISKRLHENSSIELDIKALFLD